MKKVRFYNCWVGCYVGNGKYEGSTCPDIIINNVPESEDIDCLFDTYLEVLCGTSCHDKKNYKVSYPSKESKKHIKLTSRDELYCCWKEYIEVDYNDLINWVF